MCIDTLNLLNLQLHWITTEPILLGADTIFISLCLRGFLQLSSVVAPLCVTNELAFGGETWSR